LESDQGIPEGLLCAPRHRMARRTGVDKGQFHHSVVRPIMGQVAAKRIKRQFGLVIAAVCGRAAIFPIHASYSEYHTTSPIQTFSSEVCRAGLDPDYNYTGTGVPPADNPLHLTTVPVYPTWNGDYAVPKAIMDRFRILSDKYGIDAQPFIET
jgi:hypothetical protein